jgi:hypothetical protein
MEALKAWSDAGLIVWYYADAFEEIIKRAGPEIAAEDLLPKTKSEDVQDPHSPSPEDAAGI